MLVSKSPLDQVAYWPVLFCLALSQDSSLVLVLVSRSPSVCSLLVTGLLISWLELLSFQISNPVLSSFILCFGFQELGISGTVDFSSLAQHIGFVLTTTLVFSEHTQLVPA